MAEATNIKLTTSTKSNRQEYKSQTASVLAKAFRADPAIRFVTSSLSDDAHNAYLESYMNALMKAAMLNDAVFQEAENFQSVAVWMPPGKRVDNWGTILQAGLIPVCVRLGIGGVKKMLVDFQAQSDKLKKKHLAGIPRVWYLFFIATDEEARGKGLATKLIRKWQEFATKEKTPIWLEATTAKSRDVYKRCGFEVLDELLLGKGTHNAQTGLKEKGGEGVALWAMIWKPETE